MEISSALAALSVYAGVTGLIGLVLMMNVGRLRTIHGISIGDGGNLPLIRAMRGHANFVENVPLCLVLLLLMAMLGAPVWAIHMLGGLLAVGRLLHAVYFIRSDGPLWPRSIGTGLSMLVLLAASAGLIGHGLFGISG